MECLWINCQRNCRLTFRSFSKLFEALTYPLVVSLEYSHKLEKGKRLRIEVYGDVTLEDVAQVEVKLYADALRDGHQNIWNTLNNWLNNAFDHRAYESLILLTNQEYSPRSTLISICMHLQPKKFFPVQGSQI